MVRVPGPHTTSYDFSGIAEGPGGTGNKAPTSTRHSQSLLHYRNNLCAGFRGLSFALLALSLPVIFAILTPRVLMKMTSPGVALSKQTISGILKCYTDCTLCPKSLYNLDKNHSRNRKQ